MVTSFALHMAPHDQLHEAELVCFQQTLQHFGVSKHDLDWLLLPSPEMLQAVTIHPRNFLHALAVLHA